MKTQQVSGFKRTVCAKTLSGVPHGGMSASPTGSNPDLGDQVTMQQSGPTRPIYVVNGVYGVVPFREPMHQRLVVPKRIWKGAISTVGPPP